MEKQTLTIEKQLAVMKEAREQYKPDEEVLIRVMKPGQWFAQGDVQIEYLGPVDMKSKPKGMGKPRPGGQVAVGNTQGSRHILEGDFQLFERQNATALQGPFALLRERAILTHPEHRNVSLPSGHYSVTYQRDFQAEEVARVQD